ncbi:hypothetical protein ES703_98520 [subsurface metagenome]
MKATRIGDVVIIRNKHGKPVYHLPHGMFGPQLAVWKKEHKDEIRDLLYKL